MNEGPLQVNLVLGMCDACDILPVDVDAKQERIVRRKVFKLRSDCGLYAEGKAGGRLNVTSGLRNAGSVGLVTRSLLFGGRVLGRDLARHFDIHGQARDSLDDGHYRRESRAGGGSEGVEGESRLLPSLVETEVYSVR